MKVQILDEENSKYAVKYRDPNSRAYHAVWVSESSVKFVNQGGNHVPAVDYSTLKAAPMYGVDWGSRLEANLNIPGMQTALNRSLRDEAQVFNEADLSSLGKSQLRDILNSVLNLAAAALNEPAKQSSAAAQPVKASK